MADDGWDKTPSTTDATAYASLGDKEDDGSVLISNERGLRLTFDTNSKSEPIVLSAAERLLFLLLGMAPVMAWDCVFVSEAYFFNTLGPAVISELGLCQNLCNFAGQGALLLVARQVTCFRRGVACCLLYMAAMCAFYLFVPLARLRPWHLYLWQVGNGFATGGAQTLLGQLGGMYGGAGQVGSLLFTGNSLGALLPPVLQAGFLVAHATAEAAAPGPGRAAQLLSQQRQAAEFVFGTGLLGSLLGVGAIVALTRTVNFRALTASAAVMEANEDYMTLGSRKDITRERLAVAQVRSADTAIVLVRACWLFLLGIAPYAASTATGASSMFWRANLATLLIISATAGDFAGRLVANCERWVVRTLRPWLQLGSGGMLGFVALAVGYTKASGAARSALGGDAFYMVVFFAMSAAHGYLLVCLQSAAQVVCGFIPGQDACPVVSQLAWMCSQSGLVCGIVLSFIPLGVASPT